MSDLRKTLERLADPKPLGQAKILSEDELDQLRDAADAIMMSEDMLPDHAENIRKIIRKIEGGLR